MRGRERETGGEEGEKAARPKGAEHTNAAQGNGAGATQSRVLRQGNGCDGGDVSVRRGVSDW